MNRIPYDEFDPEQFYPDTLPGIGPALCQRLDNHGFHHLGHIINQFYQLGRDFPRFHAWLTEVGGSQPENGRRLRRIGTNRRFNSMAFQALLNYYRGLPE